MRSTNLPVLSPTGASANSQLSASPMEEDSHLLSIINNVLGPVGRGPSSSHTMAPHRSALEAYGFLGGPPETAHVQFLNSFSTTGTGHRSHIAIAAGLLGMDPKDPRFASALALASEQGLEIFFEYEIDSSEHPNTIIMDLRRGEKELSMKVQSTGGGNYTISADCTGQSIRRKAGPLC